MFTLNIRSEKTGADVLGSQGFYDPNKLEPATSAPFSNVMHVTDLRYIFDEISLRIW